MTKRKNTTPPAQPDPDAFTEALADVLAFVAARKGIQPAALATRKRKAVRNG